MLPACSQRHWIRSTQSEAWKAPLKAHAGRWINSSSMSHNALVSKGHRPVIMTASCVGTATWMRCHHRRVKLYRGLLGYIPRRFAAGTADQADLHEVLFDLCQRRHFITGDKPTKTSLLRGSHSLGPLGTELKKNLMSQWWNSMVFRERVLAVETLHQIPKGSSSTGERSVTVSTESLQRILQNDHVTKDQLAALLEGAVRESGILRRDLLYGALAQYVPCLDLVNRKLPFGLAEIGKCFHPVAEEGEKGMTPARTGERTVASLAWFCSARTSGQWRDYWLRHRLLWWQKFARGPSGFATSDHHDDEGRKGLIIHYHFPWGKEPVETLYSMDETCLVQMHSGSRSTLHGRDGRKDVTPHVLWASADLDRGMLAYLFDALQVTENPSPRNRGQQRKCSKADVLLLQVLQLHPTLAPIKVSLDMETGPTVDLQLVCQGLSSDLRESGVSVWPGYTDTLHVPLDQLLTKYDEMGIIFTVLVGDGTLENGLLQLRSRDTTLRETMHISKVRDFLAQYITAARNL
ncbi:hypothetical protein FKM82_007971 [Ascaphus truei]